MKSRSLVPLLTLILGTFLTVRAFAISVASLDDFQTGTVEGWMTMIGPAHAVPANKGPLGAGDFALFVTTTAAGPGSNLATTNTTAEWTGNYITAGVAGIMVDARNVNGASGNFPIVFDIDLRLSVNGAGGAFSTAAAHILPNGPSPWQTLLLFDLNTLVPITDAAPGGGGSIGFDLSATLGNVSEIRLVHNPAPAWRGLAVNPAGLRLDNITAVAGVLVPIPASLPLLLSAVAGLGFVTRSARA